MKQASVLIENVSKSYGNTRALDEVSLRMGSGELFGLIGPDGAGKTTLFRILTTLLLPDSGRVLVEGYDAVKQYREIRRITGYMAGRFSLYQDLTVEENLQFYATVFGTSIRENYELIREIYSHIEPFKDRRAGKLSGGMKQKLALSCALIHKPRLLVLDEPTTGVDAVSRKEFWEILIKLKAYDISILVSTPYMDEAGLCDRVALIQDGSILSLDTPSEIVKKFSTVLYSVTGPELYRMKTDLEKFRKTRSVFLFGQELHLTLHGSEGMEELESFLREKGHNDIRVDTVSPGIEDCFLELVSGEDRK